MNFVVLLCIVCSFICAAPIGNSDAAVTAWTTPAITGASGSGSFTVDETVAAGSLVATLACTVAGTATYAIATPVSSKFSINSASGDLTTASVLDYDTDHPYVLTVTCTDIGDSTDGTATITINVNDQPTFTTTQFAGTIPDGSTEGATATVTVSATDQNTDDTLVYSITAGNFDGHWMLDGNKLKVETGKTIDKATVAGYSLTVRSSDGSLDSDNMATVWIAVATCSGIKVAVAAGLAMIVAIALSMLL